jgi:Cu/Zn superoxide dismutase
MRKHTMLGVLALAAAAFAAACDDDPNDPDDTRTFTAELSGDNEVPAVATEATGTATYTQTGRTIAFTLTVSGLTTPTVGAHIHRGAEGENGPIIFAFTHAAVQTGLVASGTIDLDQPIVSGSSSITGDSLLTLLENGNAYTNVHTTANPDGEIRGQIEEE